MYTYTYIHIHIHINPISYAHRNGSIDGSKCLWRRLRQWAAGAGCPSHPRIGFLVVGHGWSLSKPFTYLGINMYYLFIYQVGGFNPFFPFLLLCRHGTWGLSCKNCTVQASCWSSSVVIWLHGDRPPGTGKTLLEANLYSCPRSARQNGTFHSTG